MAQFVEVAVTLPVRGTFHYAVPERMEKAAVIGARVLAPFGGRGVSGVVVGLGEAPVELAKVRPLDGVVDGPPLPEPLMKLCRWIADYYEAPLGEVLSAALPAGSLSSAAKRLELSPLGLTALSGGALPKGRRQALAMLEAEGGSIPWVKVSALGLNKKEIELLLAEGLLQVELRYGRPRVRQKTVRTVRCADSLPAQWREKLARAPKRYELVEMLASGKELDVPELGRAVPRAAEHLRRLSKDGFVVFGERTVAATHRPACSGTSLAGKEAPELNQEQAAAFGRIRERSFAGGFAPFLLHGVTGSGKTEVYLRAIGEVFSEGKSAIVLVPEISLTPQLAARFRARFGSEVAVLHSGLRDRERFDEWHRLANGTARIALGARSAVFAPVTNLGMVVVDEEHDSSFKQEEGVRYNGRDVALVRAKQAGAVCVLGSATPSVESFQAARTDRYSLLTLSQRATAGCLPEVELIDLRTHQADSDTSLTAPLNQALAETLARGEQAILFLNRRGFHTFVLCTTCGHSFRCPECSVSLTFHKNRNQLTCHYCGHRERPPEACPSCAGTTISRRGLGTERVAEAISERIPLAKVARLDRDVAGGGRGVQAVLEAFAKQETNVLVGAQMVTKGHDFPEVTLVGVLCADTGLSLPDFRAAERTFQLLAQVAGRAGRGDCAGRVLIQSYQVKTPAVAFAKHHDYDGFVRDELSVRKETGYPPFGHLIAIRLDGPDGNRVAEAARELARGAMRLGPEEAGVSVLGPCEAPLSRLKGRTRWHLWLRGKDRTGLRRFVRSLPMLKARPDSGLRISVDVDPVSAL